VVVHDGRLVVSDVTGDEPRELARVDTPMRTADELLLVGEHVVLLGGDAPVASPGAGQSADGQPGTGPRKEPGGVVGPGGGRGPAGGGIVPGEYSPRTRLTTVDLSDPSDPHVIGSRSVDGSYVTAREHDGTVRVVVGTQPRLPFVHPRKGVSPDEAEASNRELVRHSSARDWLPSVHDAGGGSEPLLRCSDVRRPHDPSGLATTTVLTLDPEAPAHPEADAVVADGSLVYASTGRLYVATTAGGRWEWSARTEMTDPQRRSTQVHAFDTAGDDTSYVASGTVRGTVPDRWALSERDGRLRVASMRGDPWQPSGTTVSVLEEEGDRLDVVGSVGGMGETEQIRAVRWFGDVAVVVTFRQTDPLYTLDLSDPTNPRIAGELKMRGFSAYLHPVGGDLLLGVGQDATGSGRQTGSQLASFDLSDLSGPTRVDRLALGAHGYSPVEQDSRAFTYLPGRRLVFVPVLPASGTAPHVLVARVGKDGGLAPVESLPASGPLQRVRSLPVDGGRVAIVADGAVRRIVDPGRW
ncbi:MAG: beta-propeller domain-containing protein, partial [Nocardioidaceae bacterium]